VGGDLNLPNIDWNLNCVCSNNYPSALCTRFLDVLLYHSLSQIVTFPTRQQNALDIFITNRPTLVKSCTSIPGISDHEAVCIDYEIFARIQKSVPRKVYLWKKANFNLIEDLIFDFNEQLQSSYDSSLLVNVVWDKFKKLCMECLKLIPVKHTSTRNTTPLDFSCSKTIVLPKTTFL